MRVLLVEDDPMIGKGLQKALREAAMSVDWARTGAAGLEAMAVGNYAIALLDLGTREPRDLADVAFTQPRLDDRLRQVKGRRDDFGGLDGAAEIGRDDQVDVFVLDKLRQFGGLRPAGVAERRVGCTLPAPLGVPNRLAVAHEENFLHCARQFRSPRSPCTNGRPQ